MRNLRIYVTSLTLGVRPSGLGRPPDRPGFLVPAPGARRHADARGVDHAVRRSRAAVRGLPRPHRVAAPSRPSLPAEGPLRPVRPGTPGLGGRPPLQPRLPRAPHVAAGAGLRAAAPGAGRADLLPAARPLQAAL